jgi:hypothetical protein
VATEVHFLKASPPLKRPRAAHSHPEGIGFGGQHDGRDGGSSAGGGSTSEDHISLTLIEALQSQLGLKLVQGDNSTARILRF